MPLAPEVLTRRGQIVLGTIVYSVNINESGQAISICDNSTGDEVPMNPEDGRYATFLTWVSHQPEALPNFPNIPQGNYVAMRDQLIEMCKISGLRLYLADVRERTYPVTGKKILAVDPAGQVPSVFPSRWHQLRRCRANPEDMLFFGDSSGLYGELAPLFVSSGLLARLNEELQLADSDVRKLSSWPEEKTFVYFDISDYSKYPAGQQAVIVNSLARMTRKGSELWTSVRGRSAMDALEAALCLGDGYVFVLGNPTAGLMFAANLAALVEAARAHGKLAVPFHFRASVHADPVYRFWDWGRGAQGDWNYIGTGINGGRRVLDAIGPGQDDVLFLSSAVRDKILAAPNLPDKSLLTQALHNRGRRADKHGNMWRVYEANHTAIVEVTPPTFLI